MKEMEWRGSVASFQDTIRQIDDCTGRGIGNTVFHLESLIGNARQRFFRAHQRIGLSESPVICDLRNGEVYSAGRRSRRPAVDCQRSSFRTPDSSSRLRMQSKERDESRQTAKDVCTDTHGPARILRSKP